MRGWGWGRGWPWLTVRKARLPLTFLFLFFLPSSPFSPSLFSSHVAQAGHKLCILYPSTHQAPTDITGFPITCRFSGVESLITFIMFVGVSMDECTLQRTCDGQKTTVKSRFSYSSVWKELGDPAQSVRLGTKWLYQLSHPTHPDVVFLLLFCTLKPQVYFQQLQRIYL